MRGPRGTQCDKILGVLLAAQGQEVPLPRILELKISQFGARILSLRRLGFRIVNRTETINGRKHSWYRLERGPDQSARSPQPDRITKAREWLTVARGERPAPQALPAANSETGTLFPGNDSRAYRDPEETW